MRNWVFLLSFGFIYSMSNAQDLQQGIGSVMDDINPQGELFAASGPRVDWGPAPKFFTYQYYHYGPVNIEYTTTGENNQTFKSHVPKMDEVLTKLKFPILLKEHATVIGGLQYHSQRYFFEEAALTENSLYRNLHNRQFEQIRFDTYVNFTMSRKRFLGFKTGIQLGGNYSDRNTSFDNYVRIQHTGMMGKRYSENFAFGGAYFIAHQPGRLTVYPALYITYWKNKKIGFESVFPALVNLYYHPWKKSFFIFSTALKSNRYILNSSPVQLSKGNTFMFSSTDAQFSTELQQQIYDFIWVGFQMGFNLNIRNRIAETQRRDSEILYTGKQTPGAFIQFSASLTIPEKILNKNKMEEKP